MAGRRRRASEAPGSRKAGRSRSAGIDRARGFRRLSGLDRSGPKEARTRRGEPLRPLTIPNLVGYARLAAIPVFLVLAFDSQDGRTAASAVLYLAIAATDYLDGFLARVTGQYSRMGSLLDPLVDRLTILSGIAVCWNFDLLPHWALIVLGVREVVTLVLAEMVLQRGGDIDINWLGRSAVWLTMGGIFLALVTSHWIALAVFGVGLTLAVGATLFYVRPALDPPPADLAPGPHRS